MPLQNRASPLGEVVAEPGRGLLYGNRGCLHDAEGRIRRRFRGRRWIACRLEFRGRRRGALPRPGEYTGLFFLDEAAAFAAGHRPCAECRHRDHVRFVAAWTRVHPGERTVAAIDARLHAERVADEGTQRRHGARLEDLPDGAYVLHDGAPRLVLGRRLLTWTAGGYRDPVPRPARAEAVLLTPPSLVEVLRGGWEAEEPLLHPSAAA